MDVDEALARTGWPLRVADDLGRIDPPTDRELAALRRLSQAGRPEHGNPEHRAPGGRYRVAARTLAELDASGAEPGEV